MNSHFVAFAEKNKKIFKEVKSFSRVVVRKFMAWKRCIVKQKNIKT